MKKMVVAGFLLLLNVIGFAQLPATRTVLWDPNPPTDNVLKYVLTINGAVYDIEPTVDPSCICIQRQFSITQLGTLVISVQACNEFGCSQPTTINKVIDIPGKSQNLRIK